MSDTVRTKTVTLGGKERTLKLTAGHVRYAQIKGIEVIPEEVRTSDMAFGTHLVYLMLLPDLSDDEGEDDVMRWLMDCEESEALCAWAINRFFDAEEVLGESLAERHKKRIKERQNEMLEQMMARLGSNSTS